MQFPTWAHLRDLGCEMARLKLVAPPSVRKLILANNKRGLSKVLEVYSPNARLGAGGPTLLELAAGEDKAAIVCLLTTSNEDDSDEGCADASDGRALMIAAERGNTRCLYFLLNGDGRARSPLAAPSWSKGRTPLHAAAEHGHVKVASELIQHKAKVDARDNQGRTPLLLCVEHAGPSSKGHLEMVWLLVG